MPYKIGDRLESQHAGYWWTVIGLDAQGDPIPGEPSGPFKPSKPAAAAAAASTTAKTQAAVTTAAAPKTPRASKGTEPRRYSRYARKAPPQIVIPPEPMTAGKMFFILACLAIVAFIVLGLLMHDKNEARSHLIEQGNAVRGIK